MLKNEMWHLPERAEMDSLQPTFLLIDLKSHSPSFKKKKSQRSQVSIDPKGTPSVSTSGMLATGRLSQHRIAPSVTKMMKNSLKSCKLDGLCGRHENIITEENAGCGRGLSVLRSSKHLVLMFTVISRENIRDKTIQMWEMSNIIQFHAIIFFLVLYFPFLQFKCIAVVNKTTQVSGVHFYNHLCIALLFTVCLYFHEL